MTEPKLIHLGPCEVARLEDGNDMFNGEPSLEVIDAGGTSRGALYPASSIAIHGEDNLRRLADLLAPYATKTEAFLRYEKALLMITAGEVEPRRHAQVTLFPHLAAQDVCSTPGCGSPMFATHGPDGPPKCRACLGMSEDSETIWLCSGCGEGFTAGVDVPDEVLCLRCRNRRPAPVPG